jgi:hypothetical protein
MIPIKNMWSEVKKTMRETRPDLPPRDRDALQTLVLDPWHELRYVIWTLSIVLMFCNHNVSRDGSFLIIR